MFCSAFFFFVVLFVIERDYLRIGVLFSFEEGFIGCNFHK